MLTVEADKGYVLKSLRYNGIDIKNEAFMMPASNVVITAEFEPEPGPESYAIILAPMTDGTVVPSRTTAIAGTKIDLNVFPRPGYQLKADTLKATANGEDITITDDSFVMPAKSVTIHADFEPIPEPPEPPGPGAGD
jgi:hypothetical protein